MNILKRIRSKAGKNKYLNTLIELHLASSGLFDSLLLNYELSENWRTRIADVLASADNRHIPRVAQAGQLKKGIQTMHNGIRVYAGSYYGPEVTQMLVQAQGVHEPQEEYVFQEILKLIPTGGVMLEMGSYWSFYSMWFQKEVKNAYNLMIEPEALNLKHGQRNFKLNKMTGIFEQGFIGRSYSEGPIPTFSVDYLVDRHNLSHIHILHSDIQGFENDMLEGALQAFTADIIDYVFISTHSNEIHQKALEQLRTYNHQIICEVDLDKTYSYDGLIVSCSKRIKKPEITISKKGS